jgi:hypothetical protein
VVQIECETDWQGYANCRVKNQPTVASKYGQLAHLLQKTGTGRISRLKLRTMTLWESEDSTGMVSLGELFKNSDSVDGESHVDLEQLAYLTCRGGWPKAVLRKSEKAALAQAFDYYESVVSSDIKRVDPWTQSVG